MMKNLRILILGSLLGAAIGFMLGINYGRDQSLFSNPFAERSLKAKAKAQVKDMADKARSTIHDATKPVKKALNK